MSRAKYSIIFALIFLTIFLYRCEESDTNDDDDNGSINWQPCPLYYDAGDNRAQCATIELPMDYENPDGQTIPVLVKRLKSAGNATAQLWLLQGGPGVSGVETFGEWMDILSSNVEGLDVYTLDHRGVGGSTRLGCPDQESESSEAGRSVSENELDACITSMQDRWGDDFYEFTVSNAARDVGELIERTRVDGQRVFVWGWSYGAYWTHRYMQLYPDQADGVILEGIVPPDASFAYHDEYFNLNARKFFDLCAQTPDCAAHLGEDPWASVGELITMLESGHCGQIPYSTETMKQVFGALLYYEELRELLPAVIHRLRRCRQEDVNAFSHMINKVFGPGGLWEGGSPNTSTMLSNHVIMSEMWDNDNPPSYEQMKSIADACYISQGNGPKFTAMFPKWPKYPRDQYDDRFAGYTKPLLMLQGGLDPTAPVEKAEKMRNVFNHANQTFVLFREGPHRITLNTPITGAGSDCAAGIMYQFLRNPDRIPDTSCIQNIESLDFRGDIAWVQNYFGTSDLWGN